MATGEKKFFQITNDTKNKQTNLRVKGVEIVKLYIVSNNYKTIRLYKTFDITAHIFFVGQKCFSDVKNKRSITKVSTS